MTAHWIAKVKGTTALQLKTALIAFHYLCGRHDGKTLAETVLKLPDRAQNTVKVSLLHEAPIMMHTADVSLKVGHLCFAHVVDLSSKQVKCNANNMVDGDRDDSPESEDETATSGPITFSHNVV